MDSSKDCLAKKLVSQQLKSSLAAYGKDNPLGAELGFMQHALTNPNPTPEEQAAIQKAEQQGLVYTPEATTQRITEEADRIAENMARNAITPEDMVRQAQEVQDQAQMTQEQFIGLNGSILALAKAGDWTGIDKIMGASVRARRSIAQTMAQMAVTNKSIPEAMLWNTYAQIDNLNELKSITAEQYKGVAPDDIVTLAKEAAPKVVNEHPALTTNVPNDGFLYGLTLTLLDMNNRLDPSRINNEAVKSLLTERQAKRLKADKAKAEAKVKELQAKYDKLAKQAKGMEKLVKPDSKMATPLKKLIAQRDEALNALQDAQIEAGKLSKEAELSNEAKQQMANELGKAMKTIKQLQNDVAHLKAKGKAPSEESQITIKNLFAIADRLQQQLPEASPDLVPTQVLESTKEQLRKAEAQLAKYKSAESNPLVDRLKKQIKRLEGEVGQQSKLADLWVMSSSDPELASTLQDTMGKLENSEKHVKELQDQLAKMSPAEKATLDYLNGDPKEVAQGLSFLIKNGEADFANDLINSMSETQRDRVREAFRC